jgi:hypothetical protein
MTTFEIGNKFIDVEEGNIFTVTEVVGDSSGIISINLEDEDGIPTTYPDHFDDGDFEDWFEPLEEVAS